MALPLRFEDVLPRAILCLTKSHLLLAQPPRPTRRQQKRLTAPAEHTDAAIPYFERVSLSPSSPNSTSPYIPPFSRLVLCVQEAGAADGEVAATLVLCRLLRDISSARALSPANSSTSGDKPIESRGGSVRTRVKCLILNHSKQVS
jgi:hypothetical protein